mmetsp:Transcript_16255/g.18221  ORF Transcript_16255/g.18221 Transcript_16255/m.18221 type:complete len:123 (+) Transcript_16255:159-527(+)|eukprot:CAMPEP_0170817794 /NCGR_PEP_ID=MMETSP0733-20121128/40263_1 /TAXON_ID=186038 /ORGANISM="Fragilariopsis kerguelensis, Strain L26-C5" /LENGTH=122 /DNA_ID=CAMNT_0011177605 /DNA_START=147 /DNA_END=515 /DNA_ORIENTATION=+
MASLNLSRHARQIGVINQPRVLYKRIVKELPRVLMIYDIDMNVENVKKTIRQRFYDNKDVKDDRVQEMLIEVGYFQLETSMLQHKQKNHLMHFLEGYTIPMEAERKRLMSPDEPIEDQFARN